MQYYGKYGECGTFVNDYLSLWNIPRIFESSFDSKKGNINVSTKEFDNHWQSGLIAVFNSKSPYGHVGITKVIDGKLYIVDSNKIDRNTVNIREFGEYERDNILGYFDPKKSRPHISNIYFTSYNPVKGQTDSDPCTGASGVNQCVLAKEGKRIIALSRDLLGADVNYEDTVELTSTDQGRDERCNGEFIVLDTMNKRYTNRGDIFFMERKDNIDCNANILIK